MGDARVALGDERPATDDARSGRSLVSSIGTRLSPIAAFAATLAVGLALIDALPVGVVHDDGMYVVLAKSLATGQGYRWLNVPGAPPATHYPPGYPALLSIVWRLFPDFPANVVAFKALNAVLLAIAAGMLVLFARRRLGLSARAASLAALAGCLAVPTLVLSTIVMSEMLFLALLVPALLFAERVTAEDKPSLGQLLSLGALGGALMLVRTHGVAFVAAAGSALLIAHRRSAVARRPSPIAHRLRAAGAFAAAALVVVLPWQLWQASHRGVVPEAMRGDYESYGNWLLGGMHGNALGLAARTVAATSRELFATIVGLTTAGLPTVALRLFVSLAAIGLIVAGLVRMWPRARVTVLFMTAYLAIVLLWPFTPGRFLWGIWPLLLLAFVSGALAVKDWAPAAPSMRAARYVVAAGALLVVCGYGVYTARGYRGRWWSSIGRQMAGVAVPSVLWTAEHTGPNDVVSTNAELMVYLYTGRHAVPATRFSVGDYFAVPSVESRAGALRSILEAYRVDVVAIVANDSLEAAARRMALQQPPALSLRDSVPHGLIFSSMVR